MEPLQRILVVIDPTVDKDFVVDRARLMAVSTGARIRFFINNSNTLSGSSRFEYEGIDGEFFEKQRKMFVDHHLHRLQALVKEFNGLTGPSGNPVQCDQEFTEAPDLTDSIIRQVEAWKPDLMLKSTHHHGVLKRTLITNTDWQLIRNCPCPMLLVKPEPWRDKGSIVAAVDPLHVKADQNQLDHRLIQMVEDLSRQLAQEPRVFHCYFPYPGAMFPAFIESTTQLEEIFRVHKAKLAELMSSHPIPDDNIEIVRGDLVPSLIHYLKRVNANALVIGSLSRNFLERAIVGNTAEKILDDCPCDVLVIKSRVG
ncbi:MAG: universal stress protein [Pseudohongiellaceae bacterium]